VIKVDRSTYHGESYNGFLHFPLTPRCARQKVGATYHSLSATMEIVKYCHPALRHKSQSVEHISPELKSTIRKMFDLMYQAKGIGLAANQVAIPFRFFIVNPTADAAETEHEMVFINPEIIRKKGNVDGEEGCLSIPEVYGQVPRAEEIVVEAYDLDGQGFELTTDDLLARVIQHETDHLDGVMFFDRMKETDREEIESKIKDFEADFRKKQSAGDVPDDDSLKSQLEEFASSQTFPE
jgi:peptide deformylase